MSRTVLITGSAKRVGREIALDLAKQGYNLALHYHNSKQDGLLLLEEVLQFKIKAKLYQADLRVVSECTNLVAEVKSDFTDFDVLINSASVFERRDFLEVDEEFLDENIKMHFYAPFFLSQSFAKNCNKGDVINITDTKINTNIPAFFSYLASKKALSSFSEMLALRLAPDIRVNEICPGTVLPDKGFEEKGFADVNDNLPSKKNSSPKDICETIKLLLTTECFYGQKFYIDGGEHLL